MIKVTYLGSDDPTENSECEAFGYVFPKGKAVSVEGEAARKLAGNPMFKVAGGKADES